MTILVEASNMIFPVPLANGGPADTVRMTIVDSIVAGNEAKSPAQKAEPVRAIRTDAPTTLPANKALKSNCEME